ncbi:putative diguanylate cyclase AdrA [compost metagenome]|jgi:diguanylate cyclase|uniref:diguanylate cyclase n=3 Tax=Pseudomonas TaxID=286 RepID=A0A380SW70_9PSED|nr:Protein AdrA [Pseudomonas sp. JV241A]SUQ61993.1 putative diguanylate cyclase [Pseudomonas wadenswilerensis]
MMEKKSGKGLSFVRRIYLPRIIGLGIGMLSVMAGISSLPVPSWVWGLLLFNGLAWPHLAYQIALRANVPYHAEYRNLQLDSLMGGFWTATLQFNPLPSVTILAMMAMNNFAAGGQRLFFKGLLIQGLGMLLSIALFGPGLQLHASTLQVYACLPMLTLYPMAVGWVCYRLAMKLSEHKRRLSALSRTDSLTGLLNHGSWKDLLQLKFQICQQQRREAVIAIIDIDHFKTINDTYGHVVGDCVLHQLSNELKRTLREDDLAGRYGGDEFCVILPDTRLEHASQAMERLRERVGSYRNPQLPELRISLSIGLASCNEALPGPEAWLNEADKALYCAKKAGRNQVNFAHSDLTALKLAYPD